MVRLPRPLPLAAALGLLLTACAAAGRATTATPPTPLGIADAPVAGGAAKRSTATSSSSLAATPTAASAQRDDPPAAPAGPTATARATLPPLPLPAGMAPVRPLGDAELAGTVFLLPIGTGGYEAIVIVHGARLPVTWLLARGACANPGALPAGANGEVLLRRSSTAGKARLGIGAAWLTGPLILLAENSADDQRGRDQLADDHVLLQAEQAVDLALERRVGEHLGGLLEGGRRQERVGGATPW
jgi:hypothetical protein